MFFNNLQNNQTAANVDQQSTLKSTPESTLCVELSDEELCAVNGGDGFFFYGFGLLHAETPVASVLVVGEGFLAVHH